MYDQSRIARTSSVLVLVALILFGGLPLSKGVPAAFAQSQTMSLTVSGPSYVTPGSNITYRLTVKNLAAQAITNIGVFSKLSANATHVSGGTYIPADSGVEFTVANVAASASQTLTLVVNVANSVALGDFIEITDNQIFRPSPSAVGNGVRTTVEAPGTLVAVYKDANGTPFDVKVDGFQFDNFTNQAPRVSSDDLGTADMFALFGKAACQSGTTAVTCVLSGPARKWMEGQITGMNGGHCEGMAVTSLRLFNWNEFKGKYSPADFQPGAATTINLNFPQQSIENYIASYFIRQGLDEVWNETKKVAPVAAVQQLTTDFNLANPIGYTVGIYRLEGPNNEFKDGHAITAYGVETVNANESRILVYDNNYPKQRQYITVNMAANTWRDVTASTPGEPATVYIGATSAFIDFGAWDGLLDPPLYISDVLQNPSVNHRLKLVGSTGSYDPTPRTDAPAGVHRLEATFANVTQITLDDLSFSVTNLAGGSKLLNADGAPGGLGATLSVLPTQLGEDGLLGMNESFTVVFEIGLSSKDASDFTIDAEGVPHDWTFAETPPTYDGNNASFGFTISASNLLYLPSLAK
jgi:hypothetical protein